MRTLNVKNRNLLTDSTTGRGAGGGIAATVKGGLTSRGIGTIFAGFLEKDDQVRPESGRDRKALILSTESSPAIGMSQSLTVKSNSKILNTEFKMCTQDLDPGSWPKIQVQDSGPRFRSKFKIQKGLIRLQVQNIQRLSKVHRSRFRLKIYSSEFKFQDADSRLTM